jgi:hypothetical protein
MAYLYVARQQRRCSTLTQRERIWDFGAAARLAQVSVSDGGQADGIGRGRGDEAFKLFDQGEGCGIYGGTGAGAGREWGREGRCEEGREREETGGEVHGGGLNVKVRIWELGVWKGM